MNLFSFRSMDFHLASSLLDLDEEDLTEIHRMVDEWEFNFGSIEVQRPAYNVFPASISFWLFTEFGWRGAGPSGADRQPLAIRLFPNDVQQPNGS